MVMLLTRLTDLTSHLFIGRLSHPIQNDVSDVRFGADGVGVPHEFVVTFGGISPRGLAFGKAFLDEPPGFAKQDGNVLLRVHSVADEKGDDDDVACFGNFVAILDARFLFEKGGVHFGVFVGCLHQGDLALDGFARIFILLGAMANNEQRGFGRSGRAWERKARRDLSRPRHQYADHAIVCADGRAVDEGELAGFQSRLSGCEAEFPRNDIAAEVAFADEERDDEHAVC